MPLTDKDKAAQMHALFPSQEIASRMANLAISKKPIGVGKSSTYTYYKEFYAEKIKVSIDDMIERGEPILFRYSIHCDCDNGVSRETLYKMINQAVRYLVENMDNADLKYSTWRNSVNVRRVEHGIKIEYSRGYQMVNGLKDFKGEIVTPGSDETPRWLVEMREWLEGDSSKPFQKEHLTLTSAQVLELKAELKEDRRLMFDVNCTSIKILKV